MDVMLGGDALVGRKAGGSKGRGGKGKGGKGKGKGAGGRATKKGGSVRKPSKKGAKKANTASSYGVKKGGVKANLPKNYKSMSPKQKKQAMWQTKGRMARALQRVRINSKASKTLDAKRKKQFAAARAARAAG